MNSLGCVSMGVVIKSAKPSSIFTNRWNKIQTCSARIRERNAVNPSNEVLYLFIYLYVFFVSSFWHSKQLNFMLRKWPQNDLYSLVPNWCSALPSPFLSFLLSLFLSSSFQFTVARGEWDNSWEEWNYLFEFIHSMFFKRWQKGLSEERLSCMEMLDICIRYHFCISLNFVFRHLFIPKHQQNRESLMTQVEHRILTTCFHGLYLPQCTICYFLESFGDGRVTFGLFKLVFSMMECQISQNGLSNKR